MNPTSLKKSACSSDTELAPVVKDYRSESVEIYEKAKLGGYMLAAARTFTTLSPRAREIRRGAKKPAPTSGRWRRISGRGAAKKLHSVVPAVLHMASFEPRAFDGFGSPTAGDAGAAPGKPSVHTTNSHLFGTFGRRSSSPPTPRKDEASGSGTSVQWTKQTAESALPKHNGHSSPAAARSAHGRPREQVVKVTLPAATNACGHDCSTNGHERRPADPSSRSGSGCSGSAPGDRTADAPGVRSAATHLTTASLCSTLCGSVLTGDVTRSHGATSSAGVSDMADLFLREAEGEAFGSVSTAAAAGETHPHHVPPAGQSPSPRSSARCPALAGLPIRRPPSLPNIFAAAPSAAAVGAAAAARPHANAAAGSCSDGSDADGVFSSSGAVAGPLMPHLNPPHGMPAASGGNAQEDTAPHSARSEAQYATSSALSAPSEDGRADLELLRSGVDTEAQIELPIQVRSRFGSRKFRTLTVGARLLTYGRIVLPFEKIEWAMRTGDEQSQSWGLLIKEPKRSKPHALIFASVEQRDMVTARLAEYNRPLDDPAHSQYLNAYSSGSEYAFGVESSGTDGGHSSVGLPRRAQKEWVDGNADPNNPGYGFDLSGRDGRKDDPDHPVGCCCLFRRDGECHCRLGCMAMKIDGCGDVSHGARMCAEGAGPALGRLLRRRSLELCAANDDQTLEPGVPSLLTRRFRSPPPAVQCHLRPAVASLPRLWSAAVGEQGALDL